MNFSHLIVWMKLGRVAATCPAAARATSLTRAVAASPLNAAKSLLHVAASWCYQRCPREHFVACDLVHLIEREDLGVAHAQLPRRRCRRAPHRWPLAATNQRVVVC
jgi:hypothetical protein